MADKKTKKEEGGVLEVFAGVATAAIAGAVFLYKTEKGKKSRKKIKGWMLKAKGEVLEKIEQAQDFSEATYEKTVDSVMAKYAKLKTVENEEIEPLLKELKGYWKDIKKELMNGKKAVKKSVKKTTKKVTKKAGAAKKAVKKAPAKKVVKKAVKKVAKKAPAKKKTTAKKAPARKKAPAKKK